MTSSLERLIAVTLDFVHAGGEPEQPEIGAASAISQDLLICGIGVDDYVALLDREFGPVVWEVPWLRFTDQRASFRGWGCLLFPFWLGYRVLTWPVLRGPLIPRPDPRNHPERLTLGAIAALIDAGAWVEPKGSAA